MKVKNFIHYGILAALVILFFVSAILFKVYEFEILPSPFFGALMGVFITAFVTAFLLRGQTEGETQKDRNIKIYQKQIQIYSRFSSKMWSFFYDNEKMKDSDKDDRYEKLRIMCFDELVFFLEDDGIKELTKVIKNINPGGLPDNYKNICQITNILQKSLHDDKKKKKQKCEKCRTELLIDLFDAFDQKDKNSLLKKDSAGIQTIDKPTLVKEMNITYWHFNMLGDKQIEEFKRGNWVLNLIEYGEEDWRTWKIEHQVKEGDVVFLFRRGGYGYIGAFKVTGTKILRAKEYENGKYTKDEIAEFDMYNAMDDGAMLSSNIIVMPIAYNYNGVGCYSVRRRTIEKMNAPESYNYLLDRFSGKIKNENDPENFGEGKLDNETSVELDKDYLQQIIN